MSDSPKGGSTRSVQDKQQDIGADSSTFSYPEMNAEFRKELLKRDTPLTKIRKTAQAGNCLAILKVTLHIFIPEKYVKIDIDRYI